MSIERIAALCILGLAAGPHPVAAPQEPSPGLARGIEQLRHALGHWDVVTEFLREDGSVAGSSEGTYTFRWVVEDRVLAGESEIPALGRKSGILFYVNADKQLIEMTSVGADGELWVMTGPVGGEVRTTEPRAQPDGTQLTLRFTRYAVEPDRFESKMELSADGGKTWKPGNHQVFERRH